MNEFFKPWRRRIGVAVLALACGFLVLWVRSYEYSETLGLLDGQFATRSGMLERWKVTSVDSYQSEQITHSRVAWQIPFWQIDLPLTVLSAYLLLVPPRTKKTKHVERCGD